MQGFYTRGGKRALDLLVVLLAAPLWVPLAIVVGAVVGVTLGRPIIFSQRRPGLNGQALTIYKFRTMTTERDADGIDLPDEQRLTRVGSILRKSSLDELPELINVIRGEMSLVGPRPLLMEYLDLYDEEQARRHDVRPGVTGLAQVSGRNHTGWDDQLEKDVWYVDHIGLRLDLSILLKTIPRVLLRRGINQPGTASRRRFEGR